MKEVSGEERLAKKWVSTVDGRVVEVEEWGEPPEEK